MEEIRDELCIYGNHYFVLAKECYGCDYFNSLCGGPEEGKCPAKLFDYNKYSHYADYIIYEILNGNNYIFARILGEDINKMLMHKDKLQTLLKDCDNEDTIEEIKAMLKDLDEALAIHDWKIKTISKNHGINLPLNELDILISKTIIKEN